MIFNEIYGNYYNAVAQILTEAVDGNLNTKTINEIALRKAFGESIVTIPDALLSGKWPLINNEFETPLKNKPTLPLTNLQKRWLKAIIMDPRIQLFDPVMDGLEDVEPLFTPDTFVFFDRYNDGDPFTDNKYRECFRHTLIALKGKHKVIVEFETKHGRKRKLIIPEKLEYSMKDDKFRLIGVSMHGTPYVMNMGRVSSCELVEKYKEEEYIRPLYKKSAVTLLLINERNALERVMLSFSDLEKETTKLDDSHYRIKITYRTDDETEILIRILSFGPVLKVIEPENFREKIKERIFKQKVEGIC